MAKKRKTKPPPRNQAHKPHAPEDDDALWRAFTRNIDPLDLEGRVPETPSPRLDDMLRRNRTAPNAPPSDPAHRPAKPRPNAPTAARNAAPQPAQPGQIDNRQVRRIGNGREGIDARIDLHGMRQAEAHNALRVFLFRSQARGCRMVLVITGKGGASSPSGDHLGPLLHEGSADRGVLRRNVPLWLAEPDLSPIVVGCVPAHIRHGGDGALYVQLRRKRQA